MEYKNEEEAREAAETIYMVAVEEVDRRTNDYQPSADRWYFSDKDEAIAKYKSIDLEHWFSRQCKADRDKHYLTKSLWIEIDDEFEGLEIEYAGKDEGDKEGDE